MRRNKKRIKRIVLRKDDKFYFYSDEKTFKEFVFLAAKSYIKYYCATDMPNLDKTAFILEMNKYLRSVENET
jgi:hypothetical protein